MVAFSSWENVREVFRAEGAIPKRREDNMANVFITQT